MKFKDLNNLIYFLFISFFLFINSGCHEDITELDKYKSPAWIKGNVFTQLSKEEDLKIFISCLEKTGYDTILDISGSYTVMAPTDKAFENFFKDHPGYNTINDIPYDELEAMVEFQILPNAWSRQQFQTLDATGWIDPDDKLSEPKAFKRVTLFKGKNNSYPARQYGSYYKIVDPSESTTNKIAYTQYNKFCPVFFQDFFKVYDLNYSDYEFYFDRPFEAGKIYFAEAEIGDEIPAENGFIYKTDRVVTPLLTGEKILETGYENYSYKKFLDLAHFFSEFRFNLEATNEQPGADLGLAVDSLYNLLYPDLTFNIQNELTVANDPRYTHTEHHGLLAPTDEALESFLNEYLSKWGDYNDLPEMIKRLIVNSYMSKNVVYKTDINSGFINGLNDSIVINEANIIQKTYGSNCSFLGLNEAIVPRAITSVCRPLYVTRDFEIMTYACEDTRATTALKKKNANYGFYLPPDTIIGPGGDSSLVRVITDIELNRYYFLGKSRSELVKKRRDVGEINNQILNQITESTPDGSADKEFLRTLGGNYIVVNNVDGTAQGTSPSKYGYEGVTDIIIYPTLNEEYTDNGKVYNVNGWFYFQNIVSYVGLLYSKYPEFFKLFEKAGLYDPIYADFNFLLDGEPYTLFVPGPKALEDYQVDTLSKDELKDFLMFHFVKGDLIFTDGKKPGMEYPTTLLDKSSTTYDTKYAALDIRPRPNTIEILDKFGNIYAEVLENGEATNQFIMYDTNDDPTSTSNWDNIVTGVVHEIDKVLVKDLLDAN